MTARPSTVRHLRASSAWRLCGVAVLVGALGLSVGACSTGATPAGQQAGPARSSGSATPQDGGTLSVALAADTTVIDPQLTGSSTTAILARQLVDSLVGQAEDMSFTPWLARSWDINDEHTEYTFHLRDGVTFSDGTALDAAAVKANFDRILDPSVNSTYARSLLGPVRAVTVVDPLTVRISYDKPFSTLLQGLSLPYTGIESPTSLASGHASPTTVVGSGPFVLTSFVPGSKTTMTRREGYAWGPGFASNRGPSHLDAIDFLILPEASVRLGALRSGQVQAIEAVPPTDFQAVDSDPALQVVSYDNPGVTYSLFLNTARPPFNDVRVRRAFQSAFDTAAVAKAAYLGTMKPADNILAPSTPYYDKAVADMWGFDTKRANRLLDEAGWGARDGAGYRVRGGHRLTVVYPFDKSSNQAEDLTLAQAIQAEVKDVGFDLRLDLVDPGTLIERMGAGNYDIFSFFFVRSEPDILRTVFHSDYAPPNGADVTFMTAMDDELAAAVGAPDQQRAQLYRKVQETVIRDAYAVPLYVKAFQLGISRGLHGVTWATNAKPQFYDAWLARG
jgi:peptide/nickel transport system substrate-binding protein